jgi:hypothetical protein
MADTWNTVFRRELEQIGVIRSRKQSHDVPEIEVLPDVDPNVVADAAELAGLTFSGGGIRSATFGLGILQGLAKRGLLDRVDYLSTVSGGGYIGSWLAGWTYRTPGPNPVAQVQVFWPRRRMVGASRTRSLICGSTATT